MSEVNFKHARMGGLKIMKITFNLIIDILFNTLLFISIMLWLGFVVLVGGLLGLGLVILIFRS